jgi:hypothetical protein
MEKAMISLEHLAFDGRSSLIQKTKEFVMSNQVSFPPPNDYVLNRWEILGVRCHSCGADAEVLFLTEDILCEECEKELDEFVEFTYSR